MDEIMLIRATDLCVVINFIDAAYGMHDDFKSCTGVGSTMDLGASASVRAKKNLMTKSSTESELVGVAECLPKMSYLRLCMEA